MKMKDPNTSLLSLCYVYDNTAIVMKKYSIIILCYALLSVFHESVRYSVIIGASGAAADGAWSRRWPHNLNYPLKLFTKNEM